MGRNADAFTVIWCPDDEEYGEPLLIADQHPTFGVVHFALSLRDGVWPLGMVVEYENEEWTVALGTKGQVIVSNGGIVKGPSSNGQYMVEYTVEQKEHRRQANLKGIDYGKISTITEEQAVEIHDRYLYSPERPTQKELAEEFGIGQKQVSNIVLEVGWSYLWKN